MLVLISSNFMRLRCHQSAATSQQHSVQVWAQQGVGLSSLWRFVFNSCCFLLPASGGKRPEATRPDRQYQRHSIKILSLIAYDCPTASWVSKLFTLSCLLFVQVLQNFTEVENFILQVKFWAPQAHQHPGFPKYYWHRNEWVITENWSECEVQLWEIDVEWYRGRE